MNDMTSINVLNTSAAYAMKYLETPVINQGLVRFLGSDGDHDRHTDDVIARIQRKGVTWFGGATWRGMRVSVCNWLTTEHDIDLTIETVRESVSHCT
jgi:hypothetical protein